MENRLHLVLRNRLAGTTEILEIVGRLQAELRNFTFNDAIKFLIDEFEGKKDCSALRLFLGVIKKSPEEVRRILAELRTEEQKRLEGYRATWCLTHMF
ncbi:MAG: hypothetical protein ACUVXA_03720 [Candidatus Jordarchaeum sp.]|uniref:hypothetical protein n=1 Tax=Candidatus Jordarchaeum sp. TaxID=2823881 RepID=UPI00404AFAE0